MKFVIWSLKASIALPPTTSAIHIGSARPVPAKKNVTQAQNQPIGIAAPISVTINFALTSC